MTKKRMIVLVKLRITLCSHTCVSHDHVYTVWNVNLHFSSGNRTLVDTQAVVEIVRDTGRIRAAHLTFASQRIQNFVFRMGTQALLKID